MDAKGESDKPTRPEYLVVVNHEEQYSIWPTFKDIPLGWKDAGVAGSKEDCLAHIEKVWTDIRPLSVRLAEEAQRASRPVTTDA
jgi:MbtH protein